MHHVVIAMSKKHFKAIAEVIREIDSREQRQATGYALADLFEGYNTRFDYDKFIKACDAE